MIRGQVRVIDRSRLLRRLGQVADTTLAKVEQAVRVTFGL